LEDDEGFSHDEKNPENGTRQYAFVFAPPPCGPDQIGIVFSRYDAWGRPILMPFFVDVGREPADRVLERGELLIVTADKFHRRQAKPVSLARVKCLKDEPEMLADVQRPPLRRHHFIFDPPPDHPDRIGIMFGLSDMHGNPLTPTLEVPADSSMADQVYTRGDPLIVSADDPKLLNFVLGHRSWRRAKYYEEHPDEE
jgi:hypothetical protein